MSTTRATKRKAEAELPQAYRVPSPCDDDMLDEYKCPITHDLPVWPVVAEDGMTYDRPAIEEWFQKGQGKSPMTNEPMGTKLVEAVQARNAIERMIMKGIIQGEAARVWTERQEELLAIDKDARELLMKAHRGDTHAERVVAFCYRDGTRGFEMDRAKANHWYERGAAKDDPMCVVSLGVFYLNGGLGVRKVAIRGLIWLTRAAMLGSEHGANCVGNYFADLKTNDAEAKWWYEKSKTCKTKDSTEGSREQRDKWLAEH